MSEDSPKPERLAPDEYPADVRTEEERRRWEVAVAIAKVLFGTDERTLVAMTARSLYGSAMPT
jgi:hypothetical protein